MWARAMLLRWDVPLGATKCCLKITCWYWNFKLSVSSLAVISNIFGGCGVTKAHVFAAAKSLGLTLGQLWSAV